MTELEIQAASAQIVADSTDILIGGFQFGFFTALAACMLVFVIFWFRPGGRG